MGKFEWIKSLKSQLRIEMKKFETNNQFVSNAEIQWSNCITPGVKLKNIHKDKDKFGIDCKVSKFQGAN